MFSLFIVYCIFMTWLQFHPEYTQYDELKVKTMPNGVVLYKMELCNYNSKSTEINIIITRSNCVDVFVNPPPAYYIDKWVGKLQSYLWVVYLLIIGWAIMERKVIIENIKHFSKLIETDLKKIQKMTKHDNKRNKK